MQAANVSFHRIRKEAMTIGVKKDLHRKGRALTHRKRDSYDRLIDILSITGEPAPIAIRQMELRRHFPGSKIQHRPISTKEIFKGVSKFKSELAKSKPALSLQDPEGFPENPHKVGARRQKLGDSLFQFKFATKPPGTCTLQDPQSFLQTDSGLSVQAGSLWDGCHIFSWNIINTKHHLSRIYRCLVSDGDILSSFRNYGKPETRFSSIYIRPSKAECQKKYTDLPGLRVPDVLKWRSVFWWCSQGTVVTKYIC